MLLSPLATAHSRLLSPLLLLQVSSSASLCGFNAPCHSTTVHLISFHCRPLESRDPWTSGPYHRRDIAILMPTITMNNGLPSPGPKISSDYRAHGHNGASLTRLAHSPRRSWQPCGEHVLSIGSVAADIFPVPVTSKNLEVSGFHVNRSKQATV